MRRIIFSLFFLSLITFPTTTFSDNSCNSKGVSVVFVNGIFGNQTSAKADKKLLEKNFKEITKMNDVVFLNGFNESHLAGIGDIFKATQQAYSGGAMDYDLTNILNQVHSELSTRKVLLVGHSQGTFYTNIAYDYLIGHGVPKESIAVYNIATPADRVAGNGQWLTSSSDKLINSLVRDLTAMGSAKKPLPANIDIELSEKEQNNPVGGHSLSEVYLKSVPDKIVADMQNQIKSLSESDNQLLTDGCFNAPPITFTHKTKTLVFVANDLLFDISSSAVKKANDTRDAVAKTAQDVATFTYQKASQFLEYISQKVDLKSAFIASLSVDSNLSSDAPNSSAQEILPSFNQPINKTQNKLANNSPTSDQDNQDDILERIDLLKQQLTLLQEKPELKNTNAKANLLDKNPALNLELSVTQTTPKIATDTGINSVVYPQILISEVQIAGLTDAKQEFVELYNPNNQDVDLTGWYLQRKTKTGSGFLTFAPSTLFEGKKITAKGYFLIARQGSGFVGDVFIDNPLTQDNALFLKSPNGQITDKVGFGGAQDYELLPAPNPPDGQSLGRKLILDIPTDTDNNFSDFELNIPTPKAKNSIFVAPVKIPETPKDTIAPTAEFTVDTKQTNLAFTINFNLTDTGGKAQASGIAGYTFRWKKENGAWQEDSYQSLQAQPLTFSGSRDFTGSDETTYYFQIKTKDVASNESDWQAESPAFTQISLVKKVLINEIQIDSIDGKGGTDDDWVELYNPNDVAVDLSDWSMQKHSDSDPCAIKEIYKKNFTSGATILPHGFFLVVNSKASDTLINLADMTASFSLSDNNTVYLARSHNQIVDANDANIVDRVGFGLTACFAETLSAPAITDGKSLERKSLGLDTDNNSQDFKISDTPTPKETFPKINLLDLTDYSVNPSSNIPGSPVQNLFIKWSSPSTNIDFYQVQYKLNDGDWKDWLNPTSQTQEYLSAPYSLFNDNTYFFRARATDKDGNLGNWSPQRTIDLKNPVIITEVALAGTNASTKDQWLELYNRSDKDINLDGWKIVSGTNNLETLNFVFDNNQTILAKSYFLLERTDDDTLPNLNANQIFTQSIGKNYLYLRAPNNRYVDQVYIPQAGWDENSFIIDNNHYSYERVSAIALGSVDKNWKINNGVTVNGNDRENAKIFGTPKTENSVNHLYTYYPYSFMENVTLKKDFSPYLFSGTNVQVFKGVTVTIEPGVVIKFYDRQSNFIINGTLKAVGTDTDNIIFTSWRDDQYGKDANGDGADTAPYPGSWLGLYFSPESTGSNLEYVKVRYGGSTLGFSPIGWGNTIWVDQSKITLKNSVLEDNKNRGLMLINSPSVIDTVSFLNQNTHDWPSGLNEAKAIYVYGGTPEIKNSTFTNNTLGIYIYSLYDLATNTNIEANPIIDNNYFTQNGDPIYFGPFSYPVFTQNKAENNTSNDIIFHGDLSKNMTLSPDLPYLIESMLAIPKDLTLTLEPGVVLEFKDAFSGLVIDGALNAVGAQDNKIIFKIWRSGYWKGLYFTNQSAGSNLEYVSILSGGSHVGDLSNRDFPSAIRVDQSQITLKNSLLQDNNNNGLWLTNSNSTIDSVKFINHNQFNSVMKANAIYLQGGSPNINNSNFENNTYGIYLDVYSDPAVGNVLATPNITDNTFTNSEIADIYSVEIK